MALVDAQYEYISNLAMAQQSNLRRNSSVMPAKRTVCTGLRPQDSLKARLDRWRLSQPQMDTR